MTSIKTFMLAGSVIILSACVSPADSKDAAAADASANVPTKTASPSGDKSRMLDCVGENQTSKGNTRPDCLPNDADGAARDTEAGSGGSALRP